MKFDQREWVNDIAVSTITGMISGVVLAMLVPEPPLGDAVTAGGLVGLFNGLLARLIRILLELRPPEDPPEDPEDPS